MLNHSLIMKYTTKSALGYSTLLLLFSFFLSPLGYAVISYRLYISVEGTLHSVYRLPTPFSENQCNPKLQIRIDDYASILGYVRPDTPDFNKFPVSFNSTYYEQENGELEPHFVFAIHVNIPRDTEGGLHPCILYRNEFQELSKIPFVAIPESSVVITYPQTDTAPVTPGFIPPPLKTPGSYPVQKADKTPMHDKRLIQITKSEAALQITTVYFSENPKMIFSVLPTELTVIECPEAKTLFDMMTPNHIGLCTMDNIPGSEAVLLPVSQFTEHPESANHSDLLPEKLKSFITTDLFKESVQRQNQEHHKFAIIDLHTKRINAVWIDSNDNPLVNNSCITVTEKIANRTVYSEDIKFNTPPTGKEMLHVHIEQAKKTRYTGANLNQFKPFSRTTAWFMGRYTEESEVHIHTLPEVMNPKTPEQLTLHLLSKEQEAGHLLLQTAFNELKKLSIKTESLSSKKDVILIKEELRNYLEERENDYLECMKDVGEKLEELSYNSAETMEPPPFENPETHRGNTKSKTIKRSAMKRMKNKGSLDKLKEDENLFESQYGLDTIEEDSNVSQQPPLAKSKSLNDLNPDTKLSGNTSDCKFSITAG
ncbi:hypothetical protein [Endozoicomonas sp. Mp262]|uniref:hypothetical protein n=1 Tax=Endozoicomonas sp. Mp262 TaxID=2919499 RepID=UPI0021DB7860